MSASVTSTPVKPTTTTAAPSPSQPPPTSLTPSQVEALVYDRFMQYSGFGAKEKAGEIEGSTFAKLCKETGIINKACTKTDVDLIFTRAKAKGGRKLNYSQFTTALLYLSEKRFAKVYKEQSPEMAQQLVMELIANSPGPQANAIKPDNVRFHDDKSTYTGVYAAGGPTNNDHRITLSNLLDRTPANARGLKIYFQHNKICRSTSASFSSSSTYSC